MGFTKAAQPYGVTPKFTLQSGPKSVNPNMTPVEAVKEFLTDEIQEFFVDTATVNIRKFDTRVEASNDGFWAYYCAVIGHGLVRYSQESDAIMEQNLQ